MHCRLESYCSLRPNSLEQCLETCANDPVCVAVEWARSRPATCQPQNVGFGITSSQVTTCSPHGLSLDILCSRGQTAALWPSHCVAAASSCDLTWRRWLLMKARPPTGPPVLCPHCCPRASHLLRQCWPAIDGSICNVSPSIHVRMVTTSCT